MVVGGRTVGVFERDRERLAMLEELIVVSNFYSSSSHDPQQRKKAELVSAFPKGSEAPDETQEDDTFETCRTRSSVVDTYKTCRTQLTQPDTQWDGREGSASP